MPRTLIRGTQVKDQSIEDVDLASDAVITEKIKDGNITCDKLVPSLCDRIFDGSFPKRRGIYLITTTEVSANMLDSSRTVDQGDQIDVSDFTDTEFRDCAYIYWNGQLLVNDIIPAIDRTEIQNDVARQSGILKNIIFAGDFRENTIIQIVDLR